MAGKNKTDALSKIKLARLLKGWSQIEAARRVGVHLTTYQLWERGVGKPRKRNLERLKEVLGIELDEKEDSQKNSRSIWRRENGLGILRRKVGQRKSALDFSLSDRKNWN